ncbi:hypothetical protein ACFPYM_06485 [Methylobacterium hispanicum]
MEALGAGADDGMLVDVAVLSGPSARRAALEEKFADVRSFVRMARGTMMMDGLGIEDALRGIYPDAGRIMVEIGSRPGCERIAVLFAL